MAPSSFLSRISNNLKGNGDSQNSRHSRVPSAPSSTSSLSPPRGSDIVRPPAPTEIKGATLSAPKLILTNDMQQQDSLTIPATPADSDDHGKVLEEALMTTSPTSSRSSEEDAGRKAIFGFGSPTNVIFPHQRSATTVTHLGVPSDADGNISDAGSAISSSGKKKKQLWKKKSTSSFRAGSTGSALGAALAATGMTLAHPSVQNMPVIPASPPLSRQETQRQDTKRIVPGSPNGRSVSSQENGRGTYQSFKGPGSTGHDGGSEAADDSDSDGLSFADEDIPITGFAVASSKRNTDFHDLFPDVPAGDYLIEDYGCALQREILIQGRFYISENHMCFHANIFGWVTNLVIPFTTVTALEKKMTAFVIPNAIQISTHDQKHTFASFLSRDTTYDVINNIWRLAVPGGAAAAIAASSQSEVGSSGMEGSTSNGVPASDNAGSSKKAAHPATKCNCATQNAHLPETALECVFPGTPEKIYNLMFASGFIKDFMLNNQKLLEIQISDWQPSSEASHLLARNMSYIKPLNGSIGPKQTKCELKDETLHIDFENFVVTLTTTRTPDVPSGGVFSVKTRTCIMWAGGCSTKVLVTAGVEWTGRSFVRGIIERSAIEGQRTYHSDLEKAMRAYIAEHPTEFLPEGADAADAVELNSPTAVEDAANGTATGDKSITHSREVEQRGLQWALDTFSGASKVAKQSFWDAIDIIADAWPSSSEGGGSSKTGWWIVVGILLFMNIWTYMSLNQSKAREEMTRRRWEKYNNKASGALEDERVEGVAAQAVKAFWEGMANRQLLEWKVGHEEELKDLRRQLEELKQRMDRMPVNLNDVD
ncbi:hypothetical protein FRC02_006778 [Tulasnella sp. 418]|nr:hypothetical protein FRC02_006778 [Tulasnella sp. 418]